VVRSSFPALISNDGDITLRNKIIHRMSITSSNDVLNIDLTGSIVNNLIVEMSEVGELRLLGCKYVRSTINFISKVNFNLTVINCAVDLGYTGSSGMVLNVKKSQMTIDDSIWSQFICEDSVVKVKNLAIQSTPQFSGCVIDGLLSIYGEDTETGLSYENSFLNVYLKPTRDMVNHYHVDNCYGEIIMVDHSTMNSTTSTSVSMSNPHILILITITFSVVFILFLYKMTRMRRTIINYEEMSQEASNNLSE
jgi:hypothetical protein